MRFRPLSEFVSSLNDPVQTRRKKIAVTISIGVATWPAEHIDSGQDLVKAADASLYSAKRRGRNKVVGQKEKRVPKVS